MALQIRRGTDTQRQALSGVNTPIAGELLYSTDNKKLHIGDGTTAGGTSIGYFGSVAVSGQSTIKSTGANEALTIVAGANISLLTDANTGTLTIAAAPQELTNGSLRLFQNNITSLNSNEDINIDPAGTGKVNVVGNLTATTLTGTLTGNVTGNVTGNSGSVTNGIYITDTGTVTNTMLAGSIANAKLVNSSLTIGSTAISLGTTSSSINGLTSLTSTTINSTNFNVTGTFSNQRIKINENVITGLTSNEDIIIDPSGTGKLQIYSTITAGGLDIFPSAPGGSNSNGIQVITLDPTILPIRIAQIYNTAVPAFLGGLVMARARGTPTVLANLQNGDIIHNQVFAAYTGTGSNGGFDDVCYISAYVDSTPVNGEAAGRLEFWAKRADKQEGPRLIVSSTAVTSTVPISTGSLQLFQNNLTGLNSNEDIVIAPSGTGGVKIDKVAAPTATTTASSIGYLGMPVSTVTGTGTLTLADAGKHIYITTTGQTITIPAASSVAYPIGTTITFIAGPSATTATIAIATDTLRLAGGTSTGSRTLAANGMATAVKVSGTSSAGVWYINGTGIT